MSQRLKHLSDELKYTRCPRGFPSSLRLLGQRWSVSYAKNLLQVESAEGLTHKVKLQVIMDAGLPPDRMAETLLHELLHMCCPTGKWDNDTEEDIVATLSPVLFSALRGNKGWW